MLHNLKLLLSPRDNAMKKLLAALAILSSLAVLTACLIPETFTAKIDLEKNGEFTFSYEGTLIFVPFKMGRPNQKDIDSFKRDMLRDPKFKKVEYVGNARYRVEYQEQGHLNQPFYFFSREMMVIKLVPVKKGGKRYAFIEGMRLSAKDINELGKMNIKIDGTLEIKTSGKVIEHNANTTPKFWGLFGAYTWKIKSPSDAAPRMVVEILHRS